MTAHPTGQMPAATAPARCGLRKIATLSLVAAVLAACGSTTEDRTVSGAGVGAAAGTVVGAITGLSLLEGAALGAAAGGLTGALTDQEDVDLGEPIWRRGDAPAERAAADGNLVSGLQGDLAALGYRPGPVDGVYGPKTRAAIEAYQRDHGLPVDGRPSARLAQHIRGEQETRQQADRAAAEAGPPSD